MNVKKIALFASGSGTNAQNIIRYFSDNEHIIIDSVWSNKTDAPVLTRAGKMGVNTFTFNRHQFYQTNEVADLLTERNIDLIVLAGFLWLVPKNLIERFKIINIHPSLLPKYGGKGMYGMKVHQAVLENRETETGISIHVVNPVYDDGKLLFQAKCPVLPNDSPQDVAERVHQLEYIHFPEIIEKFLLEQI